MTQTTTNRPNIIWIFGDQMRAQATGYMGDPNVHTPNIDRLAQEGLAFTSAVSGCPLCCPYRGSLLSGRYPHEAVPGHEMQLPPTMPTIATAFKEAGYHTGYFGKWHVDGYKERGGRAAMHIIPPERRGGFDEWTGYENNNSQWDCWVHGGEGEQAFHYRLPGYETDTLTDLFIDFLKRQTDGGDAAEGEEQPFFGVLSVQPPHDPYAAPELWMQRHSPGSLQLRPNVPAIPRIETHARRELAGYYAMIENLDWNLGRIRTALAEAGLAHNTHIVFFSDHGDMHGSHGQFRKTSPWEESIRVPFIIGGHVPRYANKSGYIDTVPINHVDIGPTSLGLCGIEKPDWMAGTDYAGYRLLNRKVQNEPDSAFLQLVVPTGHAHSTDRPWRGVVTKDGWKYVALYCGCDENRSFYSPKTYGSHSEQSIEGQPWLLFNLNEDPYELVNHAHNSYYRRERKQLQERLAAWITTTGDHFALPRLE